ncbi:MAG: sigma-70 family RNA polymerase sigma factor [Firmicutes bacterium]|nr:sigma-70 family RNA polymerase sigma factor [Bacillota bacterium]MBQ9604393.1 sigma-70 family RNA polymerase sigma factor [Bacillota bacterium]
MDDILLIRQAQNGSKRSEEILIEQNSRLVWSIVMRFAGRGEKEELYQLGLIGLHKAIQNFSFEYKVRLSTYAVPMIIGEIKRFLRDDSIIKISRSLKELSAKVFHIKEELERETGRQASAGEIAEKLGVSPEQVIEALEAPCRVESLNEYIGEDGGATREEKQPAAENESERMIESLALKLAVDTLEEREKAVVRLRYFMDKTQTQTAKTLGMTQVQVSRLEKKVLAKLRQRLTAQES